MRLNELHDIESRKTQDELQHSGDVDAYKDNTVDALTALEEFLIGYLHSMKTNEQWWARTSSALNVPVDRLDQLMQSVYQQLHDIRLVPNDAKSMYKDLFKQATVIVDGIEEQNPIDYQQAVDQIKQELDFVKQHHVSFEQFMKGVDDEPQHTYHDKHGSL